MCPKCGYRQSKVKQTWTKPDCVERRRKCEDCGLLFHTIETSTGVHQPQLESAGRRD